MSGRAPRAGTVLSLKAIIALVFGVLLALAIGAAAITAERTLTREVGQDIQNELGTLAFQMRYRLDRAMFERYRDIVVASSLDSLRTGSADSRREVLERLQETYADYVWIGMADPEGIVLVSADGLMQGANVSEREWFRLARRGPYVGNVYKAPDGRVVDVAAPVLAPNGQLIGVLGAQLGWSWAEEIASSILPIQKDRIDLYIVGADGTVLLGPGGTQDTVLPVDLAVSESSDPSEVRILTWPDGKRYATASSRTEGYRTYPGLGWRVVLSQPLEVAFAPIAVLRRELLIMGASLAVGFVIIGWFLAAWIGKPLREIAHAAALVRASHTAADIPDSRRFAEVSSLAMSLRSMVENLQLKESNLKSAVAESERRQRLLATILANMEDALFVNESNRIVFCNDSCVRLLGFEDAGQIVGRSPFEFFHTDEHQRIAERIRLMQQSGVRVPAVEERVVKPDGTTVDVHVTAVAFEHETEAAIMVILQDITARKSTERQLQHAQRLEAIGQLTSGLAHDFNNLLTVVIGNLDLLEGRLENNPRASELADTALKAGLRGAELTRQLLAFSRRQSLEPSVFKLNELVVNTTDLLRRTLGERIEIRLQLADDLWLAVADVSQVESALTNLSINARDAMGRGGRLTIETANKHLDAEYAAGHVEVAAGDYVMLAVSDTGTGIPPEILNRVFEPFFSTKDEGEGSGLGLAMIYGFAKQSGGHVKIYSELGHGTTVRLYLPRAKGGTVSELDEAYLPDTASASATVLVVDDNDAVRSVAVAQIQELGYRTLEAEDAAKALAILAEDDRIDLLFTDVVMPGDMMGDELAWRARELRPNLKVLFTSGFAEAFVEGGNRAHPVSRRDLLSKPYRKKELARRINEELSHLSARAAG